MSSFCTKSKADLIELLASENIKVPPLGTGNRTRQAERWSMYRLLSTFSSSPHFDFPMMVVHKDKPDFRLHLEGLTIGVELTEALPENFARVVAYKNRFMPNAMIELSYFGWGAPRMTTVEIKRILSQNRLTGMPSFENTLKWQWCQAMKSCLNVKSENLNSIGFQQYEKNWLVIYDNIPETPSIDADLNGLMSFVRSYQIDATVYKVKYDTIFIESHDHFFCIEQKCTRKRIVDLWQKHGS